MSQVETLLAYLRDHVELDGSYVHHKEAERVRRFRQRWLDSVVVDGDCLVWTKSVNPVTGQPVFSEEDSSRRTAFSFLIRSWFPEERDKLEAQRMPKQAVAIDGKIVVPVTRKGWRTCANILCVSPYHRSGKHPPPGPRYKTRTLSDDQVAELRKLAREHVSTDELVERYGVSGSTIADVASGRTYKDLPDALTRDEAHERMLVLRRRAAQNSFLRCTCGGKGGA